MCQVLGSDTLPKRLAKLDPSSDKAQQICTNAVTEAVQLAFKDKKAGQAQQNKVTELCRLPNLFNVLKFAADQKKSEGIRELNCTFAQVWIPAYTKAGLLKGKPAKKAKRLYVQACKQWKDSRPMEELAQLPKLAPTSKEARSICRRAYAHAKAQLDDQERARLDGVRKKACKPVVDAQ